MSAGRTAALVSAAVLALYLVFGKGDIPTKARAAMSIGPSAVPPGSADVRSGFKPNTIEVMRPYEYGMVGCSGEWSTPYASAATGSFRSQRYGPRVPPPDARSGCRPPGVNGGRAWFLPIKAAERGTPNPIDIETLPDSVEYNRTTRSAHVTAITNGNRVYVLSSDTVNFRSITVEGGKLFIGIDGYYAVDKYGKNIPEPKILYKGQTVRPNPYPLSVAPWKDIRQFEETYAVRTEGAQWSLWRKGDRYGNLPSCPFDVCAPLFVEAVTSRQRKTI